MSVRLGVNIDHVATLRQVRGTRYPEPLAAATLAEQAGADQIVAHLREDRRHIVDRDLRLLREVVQISLNMEMAATAEMTGIALQVRPDVVTLVPERREELTTECGLDVVGRADLLAPHIRSLQEQGIKVSLFVDPDPAQVEASQRLKVEAIELHTGSYAEVPRAQVGRVASELERLRLSAQLGREMGLEVAAGHGLDYHNVAMVARIEGIEELNIGHSIVSRALFSGLEVAVREMRRAISQS